MKKLLVLLMCFAAAVPALAADQIKFDKNGIYVSPSGWVVRALKPEKIKLTELDKETSAPQEKESSPTDYTVLNRDGDRYRLWDSRRGIIYDCDKNGCR
ncbi:hypothetical protein MUN46_010900 [Mesosutterella sp. AGMB02718]|uniref:Uncharacterized protein n=1 Tax=Mesosutterella faecium TaxID=2925194 RepID=A0ABT7IPZ3_9BURK|nr:hypothetical protein [Mesosutterella sp. AGMB02718]MDL2060444.1 hypothetical protein [Mesosutterella sp. AGMB02718]